MEQHPIGKRYGVIILAAGMSTRMGEFKPLLKLGDKTFIEWVLSNQFLSNTGIETIVVTGHERDRLSALVPEGVKVATNTVYKSGRTGSVQCGLKALTKDNMEGAYILPVDCPLIPCEVFELLKNSHEGSGLICIPSYNHKRGHPPLIGAHFFDVILNMGEDEPLRNLYREYENAIIHVEVDTETVLHNINTPSDFDRLKTYYDNRY